MIRRNATAPRILAISTSFDVEDTEAATGAVVGTISVYQ